MIMAVLRSICGGVNSFKTHDRRARSLAARKGRLAAAPAPAMAFSVTPCQLRKAAQ